jgi:hypothetical protein
VWVDGDDDEPVSDDTYCPPLDDRNKEDNRAADPKADAVHEKQSPSLIPLPVAESRIEWHSCVCAARLA